MNGGIMTIMSGPTVPWLTHPRLYLQADCIMKNLVSKWLSFRGKVNRAKGRNQSSMCIKVRLLMFHQNPAAPEAYKSFWTNSPANIFHH